MSDREAAAGQEGRLVSIHIGKAGQPPATVPEARAVAGKGLEGDRYHDGNGTWSSPGLWSEVTLVESEAVDEVRAAIGFDGNEGALRRNLVTAGVSLMNLVGVRFRVGDVVLEGIRPCDPCLYLERKAGAPGLKAALEGRGGLRARVVREGLLRVGDPVVVETA